MRKQHTFHKSSPRQVKNLFAERLRITLIVLGLIAVSLLIILYGAGTYGGAQCFSGVAC